MNPTRSGFYNHLKEHGAKIKFGNLKRQNNELSGDIIVKSCNVRPITASKHFYVNSTDEYPILFVRAALINGTSKFSGISDLANKESNRIKEMQNIKPNRSRKFLCKGCFENFWKRYDKIY